MDNIYICIQIRTGMDKKQTPKQSVPRPTYTSELRLRGVARNQLVELKNISTHTGQTINDLVKRNLHLIIDNFPAHMREKPHNSD